MAALHAFDCASTQMRVLFGPVGYRVWLDPRVLSLLGISRGTLFRTFGPVWCVPGLATCYLLHCTHDATKRDYTSSEIILDVRASEQASTMQQSDEECNYPVICVTICV